MAGRKSKLDKVQRAVIDALKTGATIVDVCAHAGIHKDTFYDWMKRGETGEAGFSDFSDAATRAQAEAKATAISTLHSAMLPTKTIRRTTITLSETRINTWGTPFDYRREEVTEIVVETPGDWRASVEYLKRRHYDEWGDKARVDDWRSQAIADIKAGRLPYEVLREAFDDSLAAELFAAAGIPISVGQGPAQS